MERRTDPNEGHTMDVNDKMTDLYNLQRFLDAQKTTYDRALQEVEDGRKRSHWIWYIFPQLTALGHSYNATYYGISGYKEAEAYWRHPVLRERLQRITETLLAHPDRDIVEVFGRIDAIKVRSCMTLFYAVSADNIFKKVLDRFYMGVADKKTLKYI